MTARWGLRRHDLHVDAIGDIGDREVRFTPGTVGRALAGQTSSDPASQVRWHEVRLDQMVPTLADVRAVTCLGGSGWRQRSTVLNRRGLSGNKLLRDGVEPCQKGAHLAVFTGAIVVLSESVADHARSDGGRSVRRGAERALSRMVRSAQRTVCVLGIESRVVRRPFGGQDDELRRNIRPQGHFDPSLARLVSQCAGHAREGATSPCMNRVIRGPSLPRWTTSAVSVDATPKLSGPRFICTCSVSARQECSAVSANPGAPANGTVFIYTAQSTVKYLSLSIELPRTVGDGLALPWTTLRTREQETVK